MTLSAIISIVLGVALRYALEKGLQSDDELTEEDYQAIVERIRAEIDARHQRFIEHGEWAAGEES